MIKLRIRYVHNLAIVSLGDWIHIRMVWAWSLSVAYYFACGISFAHVLEGRE